MRLLHCHLRQVRLHGDLQVSFAPGLTLIGGPNEAGKSTLVEALHRTLFLRAAATGAPVEQLRSRLHAGHPQVELAFEARGDRWQLAKRFSGGSGSVRLAREGEEPLTGPAAEERLADLLGVREILAGSQKGQLPSRWAHLWVMQGRGGEDLLARGGAAYDLDALVTALEQGGGAALQSPLDQEVSGRIEELLAETFTPRSNEVRRGSPLFLAARVEQEARRTLEEALERLQAWEAASDALAALEDRLEEIRERALPAVVAERERLRRNALRAAELETALRLRSGALGPRLLQRKALLADQCELGELERLLAEQQRRAGLLAGERGAAATAVAGAEQALVEARRTREGLERQREELIQRGQLVQRLSERARLEQERGRLARERVARAGRERRLAELEARERELPPIAAAQVAELRGAEQAVRELTGRLEALGTGVELLAADCPVRIDGVPLAPGAERRLDEVFELAVGEGVTLRISPGGGRALAEGRRQRHAAVQALAALRQQLGVATAEAAEAVAREREAIAQERAALLAAGGDAGGADAAAAQVLDERMAALAEEIAAQEEIRRLLKQAPLPADPEGLDRCHRALQQTYREQQALLQTADQEQRQWEQKLQRLRGEEAGVAERQVALEADLRSRRERQARLLEQHGDLQALGQAVEALSREVEGAQGELTELRRALQEFGAGGEAERLTAIEAEIGRLESEQAILLGERGGARERCERIGGEDPPAAVERARVALETAAEEHAALQRQADALQLLRQLFAEARSDLSSRYSEPLARAIESYLAPLLPAGPACRLRYDPSGGFSGLELQRGGEFFGFEALSGGMREQLTAALRLSMADVLRAGHDGCLPLIFDDAFTNADPQRVAVVKGMLTTAVERGLQVILLTCDPDPYADLVQALGVPAGLVSLARS
jgi:DNA repair exonuclease SbcCD ATPase subunit